MCLRVRSIPVNHVTIAYNCVTHRAATSPTFTQNANLSRCLKLYIKYMFSERCKTAVREELKKLGLHFKLMDLGEVDVMEDLTPSQRAQLYASLMLSGLELMEDKRGNLLQQIKDAIDELVHSDDDLQRCTFTEYLTEKIGGDYLRMAELFSEVQGISIQQHFIALKTERVKELILDGELNLTEIAFRMQYSSVGHLSNQFKKVTGHSPSHFKTIRDMRATAEKNTGAIQAQY